MKKRVAVWLHGGIGTGHFSQGIPIVQKLLERLSETFEIIIYSQTAPHQNFNSQFFQVRSAPVGITPSVLRWFYLIKYFALDHRKHRFQSLFAFWGYPAGFIATIVGKLFALPNIIYLQGGDAAGIPSINYGILHKPFVSRLARWAYGKTTLLICMTSFQKECLANYGVCRPTKVIPSGADSSMYSIIPRTRQEILHVIHVGHMTPVKDQTTLLKAFALLRKSHPAELRIFGVDCLKGQMQKLCIDLGIEQYVQFKGMVPYSQMPEHYAWADLMLHTSLSEGQSMALTEAASCGVLLAGTRVGLLYHLGDEYAVTIDPGDHKGLTEKLNLIINNPNAWESKIHKAKKWSDSHDLSWTTNELSKLLESL